MGVGWRGEQEAGRGAGPALPCPAGVLHGDIDNGEGKGFSRLQLPYSYGLLGNVF